MLNHIKCLLIKGADSLSKFRSRKLEQKVNVFTDKKTKHLFWGFIDGKWFCLSCLLEVRIRTVNNRPDLCTKLEYALSCPEKHTLITCTSIQTAFNADRLSEQNIALPIWKRLFFQ